MLLLPCLALLLLMLRAGRSVKLSTWLGRWNGGGQQWRQDYLASIEDPFDTSDNTARTLGTGVSSTGIPACSRKQYACIARVCLHTRLVGRQ